MMRTRCVHKAKAAMLTAVLAGSTLVGWGCTWADVRQNFVAGTQAFVKGYTTDLWVALFPAADDLVNVDLGE